MIQSNHKRVARHLAPRLAHVLLPISGKGKSDGPYALVPVVGPIIGGIFGALLHGRLFADRPHPVST